MASCRRDLHRALDVLLPLHIREVCLIAVDRMRKVRPGVIFHRLDLRYALHEVYRLLHVAHADDVEVIDDGCLTGIVIWKDEAFKTLLSCLNSYGQHSFDWPQLTVQ